ncbi:MAG: serine/threonine-protein kinase [Polyangiaceae bacterium]
MMAPADVRPGTVIAGSYEITETLGRGGMGTVYAARHVRTGRRVAVKLLHGDSRALPDAMERFRREARAAGSINSVYVTRVHDVEEDPQYGIAIIFELLKGRSLLDHLRANGVMSFDDAVPFVREVLAGLDDAHRAGIIHRDMKPSNVFLERLANGASRVKLLDFGVSKLPKALGGTTLTQPDQALGSFLFMPPEQVSKASEVDATADIYAFGVLLFQAMTGHLPFHGSTPIDVIHQKRVGEPRWLSEVAGKPFPTALEVWIRRCIEREPAKRFPSARDARMAWEQVVAAVLGPQAVAIEAPAPTGQTPSDLPPGLAPLPSRTVPIPQVDPIRGAGGTGAYAALPPPPARPSANAPLASVPTMVAASGASSGSAPIAPLMSGASAAPGFAPLMAPSSMGAPMPISSAMQSREAPVSSLKIALLVGGVILGVGLLGLLILWLILHRH